MCEEYKLHRETYYLAMTMYDRFMDARTNVRKEQLQLLGVTCLFIASKIEASQPTMCISNWSNNNFTDIITSWAY